MNNKTVLILECIFLIMGMIIGYYSHEVKDQKEIYIEAQKIYNEWYSSRFNNTYSNISICGCELNGK